MVTLTLTLWPINSGVLTSLLLPHLSSSLTDSLLFLCYSKTDVRFMQDGRKAVWSILYVVSVVFFPSLKQNFIVYRSSKMSDCIFEIHQLWQSGFSRVYPNGCCSCSFEPKIIKMGQSSHKMYSNNILKFQVSILNTCTKTYGNLLNVPPHIYIYTYIYIYIYSPGMFESLYLKLAEKCKPNFLGRIQVNVFIICRNVLSLVSRATSCGSPFLTSHAKFI